MHLVKKETSLIMYRALTPKRYVMWKKKKSEIQKQSTVCLDAQYIQLQKNSSSPSHHYLCLCIFIRVSAYCANLLWFSASVPFLFRLQFLGGCSAVEIKRYTGTAWFPQKFLCGINPWFQRKQNNSNQITLALSILMRARIKQDRHPVM